MGLYLEPDEIKSICDKIWDQNPGRISLGGELFYDAISRAAADHAAEEIVKMYELWHRGLSDTVAMEQFQIVYKIPYRLNFATCLEQWLQEQKEGRCKP